MNTGRTTPLYEGLVGEPIEPWKDDALCAQVDPDFMFPEPGGRIDQQLALCADCPVRQQCLEYALENNEQWGIWGGLSASQRRRLKRNAS